MRTWTSEEVKTLLENYNKVSNCELEALLPEKSPQGIYKKAYKMGMRKSAEAEFRNRSEARKREKAPNWKGGVSYTRKGYRTVFAPGHHRADKKGYVMEHILVWEKETGVAVPQNCCIHHLNGDKTDNRISNLCMMQFSAHTVFHHTGKKRDETTKQKIRERKKKNGSQ